MSQDAVFTFRALEVILQRSVDVSWLDALEYAPLIEWGIGRVSTSTGLFYSHFEDDKNVRKVIIHAIDSGESLDRLPKEAWRQSLQRVYRAAMATLHPPVRLPQDWSEFHFGNLLAFFACSRNFGTYRWLAEVGPSGSRDISFWKITDEKDPTLLIDFVPPVAAYKASVNNWTAAYDYARAEVFAKYPKPLPYVPVDGVVDLKAVTYGAVTGHLTYSGWAQRLTADQRRFFDHSTGAPLKLRGPAGSGKTLTLELRALRELYEAADAGQPARILFVTHSWAMAEQVDLALRTLDERGLADDIQVYPLVEVAKSILPPERFVSGLDLLGSDSYDGRRHLLRRISETLSRLRKGDWLAYAATSTPSFRERVESAEDTPEWNSLVWDLMHEFSSVLAASGILPGITAEKRYLALKRASWMMSLQNNSELKFVMRVYSEYVQSLKSEKKISLDQLMNDFLSYLETFSWDYRRASEGYTSIFVDEFHLFANQERQILGYLSSDPQSFPRLFMALDPRQSISDVYADFQVADVSSSSNSGAEGALGPMDAVDLRSVHRFSAQILELVKFIHQSFPTFQLGTDWVMDTGSLGSEAADNDPPRLYQYGDVEGEVAGAVARARARHEQQGASRRVALILLDERRLPEFEAALEAANVPFVAIKGRDDIDELRYRKRSVVLGVSDYVAGLQFDDVVVAGFPTNLLAQRVSDPQLRRVLSSLYVAVSRASQQVEVHLLALGEGDLVALLQRAVNAGVLEAY